MNVLVIDVGGTHVKLHQAGRGEPTRIDSGPDLTAEAMVAKVKAATAGWPYDVVSIGLPSPVLNGRLLHEPVNLGGGWVDFDFAAHGQPMRALRTEELLRLDDVEPGQLVTERELGGGLEAHWNLGVSGAIRIIESKGKESDSK